MDVSSPGTLHDLALRGDARVCDALAEAPASWRVAIQLAAEDAGLLPLGSPTSEDTSDPLAEAWAATHTLRRVAMGFGDGGAARARAEALASAGGETALVATVGMRWDAWARGTLASHEDAESKALEAEARRAQLPGLVIDVAVQRALAHEARGSLAAMVAAARRASRLAQAERLPMLEYLAHLVLARARRWTGRPHLALRIVTAADEIAPAVLAPWIAWETIASGGEFCWTPATERTEAFALAKALAAARAGDRASFDAAADSLERSRLAPLRAEAMGVLAALDLTRAVPPTFAPWAFGATSVCPPAVHGLRGREEEDDADGGVVLVRVGDGRARRMLADGLALTTAPFVRVPKSRRRQGRVETLLAVLLSAGPEGLEEEECFEQTYELVYDAPVHRGVFGVLVTRARAHLEGCAPDAMIQRDGGRITLLSPRSLAVPDPRCAAPEFDRVLRLLAREGRVAANDVAQRTGLALRTVQDALKALAADGACRTEKRGRALVYVVEDTTFRGDPPSEEVDLGEDVGPIA